MNRLEITVEEISSQEREIYRTLRTNIEFTGVENRVIAVTSCAEWDTVCAGRVSSLCGLSIYSAGGA